MDKTLTAMAASMLHCSSGMSTWNMADYTLGLYKLSARHALEDAHDTIAGDPVTSRSELETMLQWLHWAEAAYEGDKSSLAKAMKIRDDDLVRMETLSAALKPAFYIALYHQDHCVVMGIRGTDAATDAITDLNAHSELFEGGHAHSGMLAAAKWLLQNEGESLRKCFESYPGYRLVITGHSLGAGTGVLLAMLLQESAQTQTGAVSTTIGIAPGRISFWGFGCPPCVDRNLALAASFANNVVFQDDVVSRVSPAALEDLRSEIVQTEWNQAFKDGTTQRKVADIVKATCDQLEQVELPPGTIQVYNKVKEQGYSAFLGAGSALVSRITGVKLGTAASSPKGATSSWLSLGADAASQFFTAASNKVAQDVNKSLAEIHERNSKKGNEGAAVAALAADLNATKVLAETSSDSREQFKQNRLFVPGILYHIICQPLQPGEKKPEKALGSLPEPSDPKDTVRYTVVKGKDPNSRFGRIVLSSTILSDHYCGSYVKGITDALQWSKLP